MKRRKSPRIFFTYNPSYYDGNDHSSGMHKFSEVYQELFKLIKGNHKNVIFGDLVNYIKNGDGVGLFEIIHKIEDSDMIIHNYQRFIYQLTDGRGNSDNAKEIEAEVNNLLMLYLVKEGICEGLRSEPDHSIGRKDNLPEICTALGIPTVPVVMVRSLLPDSINQDRSIGTLEKWKGGFYLKKSDETSGRFNDYFSNNKIEELLSSVGKLDQENIVDWIVTKRIKTPHKKYASHYRVFTFFDGSKTNILGAIIYYNTKNSYTVHEQSCKSGAISLVGPYVDRLKTKEEKEIIEAHGLDKLVLPLQVKHIVERVGEYAGRKGRLMISTEVLEDRNHQYYVMDVNIPGGLVEIRARAFPPEAMVEYQQRYRKTAEMIVDILKRKKDI